MYQPFDQLNSVQLHMLSESILKKYDIHVPISELFVYKDLSHLLDVKNKTSFTNVKATNSTTKSKDFCIASMHVLGIFNAITILTYPNVLNKEMLNNAINHALDKYPMYCGKLYFDVDNAYVTNSPNKSFSFIEKKYEMSTVDVIESCSSNLQNLDFIQEIDNCKHLLQVYFIECKDGTILGFQTNHGCGDGASKSKFLLEVAHYYNNEELLLFTPSIPYNSLPDVAEPFVNMESNNVYKYLFENKEYDTAIQYITIEQPKFDRKEHIKLWEHIAKNVFEKKVSKLLLVGSGKNSEFGNNHVIEHIPNDIETSYDVIGMMSHISIAKALKFGDYPSFAVHIQDSKEINEAIQLVIHIVSLSDSQHVVSIAADSILSLKIKHCIYVYISKQKCEYNIKI